MNENEFLNKELISKKQEFAELEAGFGAIIEQKENLAKLLEKAQ